jgi:hypothetical protein
MREIKQLKDKKVSRLSHFHFSEFNRLLFSLSSSTGSLHIYNIESEAISTIKFSKHSIDQFGITESKQEYHWWTVSQEGHIYRALKHKGAQGMPSDWQF